MNNNINIKIVLLNKQAKIPKKQHELDIGYDIFSDKDVKINPGLVTFATTGIAIQLPKGCGGFILPRSGLATKHLISPINSPGLIDPGYTGELMVPLMNYSDVSYTVRRHERIAQLVAITTNDLIF